MTPTQRSLAALRELGYLVEVVEKWNSFTRTRKDLWGWADLLAIRRGEVLAVQVTSEGVANRVKKVTESETIARVREAGVRVEVHGWRKNVKGRYVQRIVDLS
jgi:carbonic anhydrase